MLRLFTLIAGTALVVGPLFLVSEPTRASSAARPAEADTRPQVQTIEHSSEALSRSSLRSVPLSTAPRLAYVTPHSSEPAPPIEVTRAISIPYGFESPLTLSSNGREILAMGHGGCTAGQIVTVQVELTQEPAGALATGDMQQICNGALQHWVAQAVADDPTPFTSGPARACGVAVTRSDGAITDTFEWCRDLTLVRRIYLPLITR